MFIVSAKAITGEAITEEVCSEGLDFELAESLAKELALLPHIEADSIQITRREEI